MNKNKNTSKSQTWVVEGAKYVPPISNKFLFILLLLLNFLQNSSTLLAYMSLTSKPPFNPCLFTISLPPFYPKFTKID